MTCKHCNTDVTAAYCSGCGQAASLKRIDGHYVMHEIQHVLHFEKGILYTIRGLLLRPGAIIKHFFNEDRSRLVKPIIFIIITSLVYTIFAHLFHVEDGYIKYEGSDGKELSATKSIIEWIQGHYGYANILMGVFIAFWTQKFFKKYQYSFFETLIMLCFVMGMAMLILAVFALLQGLTHLIPMQIAGFVSIAYCTWAIGQFFDRKKVMSYVKALLAYILGTVSFMLAAGIIGGLTDVVVNLFAKH